VSRRWGRRLAGVLVLAVAAVSLVVATRTAPPSASQRAETLDAELRCPVCQGESVADSPSSTARAIAADVGRRVRAGQSDAEIRRFYVDRYGPGILLAPTGTPGVVAVALPLSVLLAGAGGLALALGRRRREAGRPVDVRDEELVARLRQERER
jgi:cytochrome c-type biogenesis protein CcmH